MAVYFVYRSHYDNPGCFHVKRFEADTVLAWFQSIWEGVSDEEPDYLSRQHAEQLVGRHVYSFGSLFGDIHEHGWPTPKTMKALVERLNEALYVNELKSGAHHVQVLTDDDELEMAIYIFDDHYAAKHPDRAAFLMREDWRLSDGGVYGDFKTPRGVPRVFAGADVVGDGRTYFAQFAAHDSGGLTDLSLGEFTGVIEGVRVPDLPRFLFAATGAYESEVSDLHGTISEVMSGLGPAVRTAKGTELLLLKAVRSNPNDTACWAAYSDWLLENGRPTLLERILAKCDAPSGSIRDTRNPKKDSVVLQSHVAQMSKHTARWEHRFGGYDLFHHLIFFDDLWANAHPHLAASILRTANRWDPL